MGQACCVPHKHQPRRTAKAKAEARSAAAAAAAAAVAATPGDGAQRPVSSASRADTHADLLHAGRIDELRDIHAADSSPVRGLREPQEWLRQKKHRVTGYRRDKKVRLPDTFTNTRDKHKHRRKHKVRVARNEAPFADNEPITLLEATLLEEIPLDEAEGQSVQTVTPPGTVHTMHLQERRCESPASLEGQQNAQPGNQSLSELLSPIPRRPANALRFPFINRTSDASMCSSQRSSKASDASDNETGNDEEKESHGTTLAVRDTDSAVPSDENSTTSTETVITRRIEVDFNDDKMDAGSVRSSISSMSPDIFYMAPTSPQSKPVAHIAAPTLVLTPASPPALPLQPLPAPSAASNPNLLDVKVPAWSPQSQHQWTRTASSPSILRSKPQQRSNTAHDAGEVCIATWSDSSPLGYESVHGFPPTF